MGVLTAHWPNQGAKRDRSLYRSISIGRRARTFSTMLFLAPPLALSLAGEAQGNDVERNAWRHGALPHETCLTVSWLCSFP